MTKTKRALLTSGLALLLCMSMLIGSTYAWFTDSVTSAGNIIKSGTLDVTMHWADGTEAVPTDDAAWTDASSGPIFESELWEPGYTEVRHIKIENVGTLALKYQLNILANGEVSELADVIDVYYLDSAVQVLDRAQLTDANKLGTLTQVLANISTTASGNLAAGENHTITLALKMQESAGNQYQDKSIGADFAIQLLATQLTAEEDSFDDQYDIFADYDGEISNATSLVAALKNGGTYKVVSNITIDAPVEIPAGVEVALDMNGMTISGGTAKDTALINNNGTLSIVGGELKNTTMNGGYTIANSGALTLKDVTIKSAPMDSTGYPSYALCSNGTLTIEEGTVIDSERGALYLWGGETTINGGEFTVSDTADGRNMTLHTVYAYGDGTKLTINDGEFIQNHSSTSGASVICPAGAAINIYGGNFSDAMDDSSWKNTGNFQNYMGYSAPVNVYGGTYDDSTVKKWVADGYKAVLVGDKYEIIEETVTYATASTADELQTALDNAENQNLIVLTADIEGDVTVKQIENLVITVDGANHKYDGIFVIDGNSAQESTSGVTLKNIKFEADSISAEACINLGESGETSTRYTCNVTVDNCTFDVPGAVGVKSYTGGDKNLTIRGCTTSDDLHSLAQLKGIDGVLVDDCKVYAIRGINFNNSINVTVQYSTVDVQKYALRFGSDENDIVENYAITECTLKSANVDGDAVVVLRAGATNANLTITNTTITGDIEMTGHENANVIYQ